MGAAQIVQGCPTEFKVVEVLKKGMKKTYRAVKIPGDLVNAIERLRKTDYMGYESFAEFVIAAARHRLEQLTQLFVESQRREILGIR